MWYSQYAEQLVSFNPCDILSVQCTLLASIHVIMTRGDYFLFISKAASVAAPTGTRAVKNHPSVLYEMTFLSSDNSGMLKRGTEIARNWTLIVSVPVGVRTALLYRVVFLSSVTSNTLYSVEWLMDATGRGYQTDTRNEFILHNK
jgi:hypothetical protein